MTCRRFWFTCQPSCRSTDCAEPAATRCRSPTTHAAAATPRGCCWFILWADGGSACRCRYLVGICAPALTPPHAFNPRGFNRFCCIAVCRCRRRFVANLPFATYRCAAARLTTFRFYACTLPDSSPVPRQQYLTRTCGSALQRARLLPRLTDRCLRFAGFALPHRRFPGSCSFPCRFAVFAATDPEPAVVHTPAAVTGSFCGRDTVRAPRYRTCRTPLITAALLPTRHP